MGYEQNSGSLVFQESVVGAPVGFLAPGALFVAAAFAVQDGAGAEFDGECGGETYAEAHFFLIPECDVGGGRLEGRVAREKIARGGNVDFVGADFFADHFGFIGLVTVEDGETSNGFGDGRAVDKFDMTDLGFVTPEVVSVDVAECKPDAGMIGGVIVVVLVEDGIGGIGTCDLMSVRREDLFEIGPGDIGVIPDVGREGFSVDTDVHAGIGGIKGYVCCEGGGNECDGEYCCDVQWAREYLNDGSHGIGLTLWVVIAFPFQ